jgi:ATP-dependent DNA helicase RecQ
LQSPHDILKHYWNYDSFRPLQKDIIDSVLESKDTLAILPTGGGKSICYQIPGLIMEGVCLVISPLIALMQDQYEGLSKRNIPAAVINSTLRYKEVELILDNAFYGAYKFIFIAPERLQSEQFIQRLQSLKLSFVAIDEAHCISEWGYDFRPSYLKIPVVRSLFPEISFLGLTASATDNAKIDIQKKLEFQEPHIIQGSFKRSNIGYIVRETENKRQKLVEILNKVKGTTLIYAATRNACTEISNWLQKKGISSKAYHAGLEFRTRANIQSQWLTNEFRVIVATNAFGMGIDKPDVRLVLHMDMPASLEAYYQEAGRAGRDGINSYAIVLHEKRDILKLEERKGNIPSIPFTKEVYQALCNTLQIAQSDGELVSYPIDLALFCQQRKYRLRDVLEAIKVLEFEAHFKLNIHGNYGSLLHIIISQNKLHEFIKGKKHYENVLKTLLRSYSGLFEKPTVIDEPVIAKRCKIAVLELQKLLQSLKQQGIIAYKEQSSNNTIDWIKPRQAFKHFSISKESIERIEIVKLQQINASIDYLSKAVCRSKQLLYYFGETISETCGICDVCRENRISSAERKEDALRKTVLLFLQEGKKNIAEIAQELKEQSAERLIEIMRSLVDDGAIIAINDLEYQIDTT